MATPHHRHSIYEFDSIISSGQDSFLSLPLSHPLRAAGLPILAKGYLCRYTLSDDKRDLDKSILQSTHAIFFPIHPSTECTITAFITLTEALLLRSLRFKQPSDVKCCVKCLHFLRNRSLEVFNISYDRVTTLLVLILATQLELEPNNAMQDIEQASILCHELLVSGVSEPLLNDAIARLAQAVTDTTTPWNPPSPRLVDYLREANTRLPDLHEVSIALSWSLLLRYRAAMSNDDFEEAMTTLDKVIAFHSPEKNPSQYVRKAKETAGLLAYIRYSSFGNPRHWEEAIFRIRDHLKTISPEDPTRPAAITSLEILKKRRFVEFGVTGDPQEVHPRDPKVVDIPSFSHLAASLAGSNAVTSLSMTMPDRHRHLDAVCSMDRITNIADIGEAMKYCQLLLASLEPTDILALITAIELGRLLLRTFRGTDNIEYLNASITVHRNILKMPGSQWMHFYAVQQLISSLFIRLSLSDDSKDFDEIMQLYTIAAADTFKNVPNRFRISCEWARTARHSNHPSISTAYQSAISLMQDSLAFAPTLEIQHVRLITMRDAYEALPLDYASYQVHIGQLEQAIETLERGRGLIWSEMRGLRASIDRLRATDAALAEKYAAVNRDLEALTTLGSQSIWMNHGEVSNVEGMASDSFGRLVVEQQKLTKERDGLISQVQALPGFEGFLKAPSFDVLRSAATRGPVIIINCSEWRSDLIILPPDSPPSFIPTNHNFYDRAKGLKDQLLTARKKGLDSKEYNDALTSVLGNLYDLVGRPVIQRLYELDIPEQSRVWWCPTSVFCSLPLHAMGPIGHGKLYFSDLYVPSYTPTLSALVEAHKPNAQTFNKPSILLVVQPDVKMPESSQEMRVIQAVCPTVSTLIREMATPASVLEHLRDYRFAHISCHGILETGKPFEASFKLFEGERLTLLEIVRSQLPTAEFAFLSACHTAELTEGGIADEALHLAGAIQYCGFRSVVGTMWAMADVDGPDLAGSFYKSVFSNRWGGLPYYERTAEALRDGVRKLRRKRHISLERWVNYVHYGA